MNKNPQVDEYMKKLDNPMKAEMERVREIILSTDDKITEDIKWSAPNFMYKGNIATFNPRAKKLVNLLFHKGAEIPGNHAVLEGEGKEARSVRFHSMEDLENRKEDLQNAVRAWIKWKDEG